jgi:hypothetical protein
VSAVGETLREQGLASPSVGSGTTFLQAKTANEVLKAQERRLRLQRMKGEFSPLAKSADRPMAVVDTCQPAPTSSRHRRPIVGHTCG